jgi:hypothetical protein
MQNGNLVSSAMCTSIEITTLPIKVDYIAGEIFDPTGMVVIATYSDGSEKIIDNYTFNNIIPNTSGVIDFEIFYNYFGQVNTTTLQINVTAFDPTVQLIDFEYTENEDGTYTLTDWKETLNGEPSTEAIVPNNGLIKI